MGSSFLLDDVLGIHLTFRGVAISLIQCVRGAFVGPIRTHHTVPEAEVYSEMALNDVSKIR